MSESIDYDAIVIGGGIGGLSAAVHLANGGMRVCVMEKSDKVGGCCTSFKKDGYTFNRGMHQHCGGFSDEKDDSIANIIRKSGVNVSSEVIKLDSLYTVSLPNLSLTIPTGLEESQRVLCQHFPNERNNIAKFYEFMNGFAAELNSLRDYFEASAGTKFKIISRIFFTHPLFCRRRNASFEKILDEFFTDRDLKAVISMICVYAGPPPKDAYGAFCVMMLWMYLKCGGYQFRSADALAAAYRARLESLSGEVRTRCEVRQIETERGAARGVVLAGGEAVRSALVVSALSPQVTFSSLLQGPLARGALKRSLALRPNICIEGCYFGGAALPERWGVEAYETLFARSCDVNSCYAQPAPAGGRTPLGAITWFGALPGGSAAPPGKSVVTIITISDFTRWARGSDPASAEELRAALVARCEREMEERYPGFGACVEVRVPLTPLDLASRGCAYGTVYGQHADCDAKFDRCEHRTEVNGLYGAGMWYRPGHGVSSAQQSGYECARQVFSDRGVTY